MEIVERTASVGGQLVRLGGIGGMSTLIAWRKRDLAKAALKTAVKTLHDPTAVDFGLLACSKAMIPYYAKFGWKLIGRPMWIDQPKGRRQFTDPIMILPVCKNKWPDGEIDLCGRPWWSD